MTIKRYILVSQCHMNYIIWFSVASVLLTFFFVLKLPLDLSPLATPIIRNKTEEPAPLEVHRNSPLPHPESTTSDEKVYNFLNELLLTFFFATNTLNWVQRRRVTE